MLEMTLEQQIQKKYADKVTPEHTAAMQAIGLFHAMIGPLRNQEMLDAAPDLVVAFPGGRRTADMVRRAKRVNVKVIEID
jgi:hypothetical protein